MFTITPLACSRMTASACLIVIHVDLRLTVMIRSHAASSARCAGPSPPPPMPTLLTRMSSRGQRAFAAAITAAQSSLRDTSARSAAAWPPSALIIATVSSARSSSRSTQRTSAPSRANRIAIARPLPIVSPGVCPAPTTMAVLSASRPGTSAVLELGVQGQPLLELHPEAVQQHRDLGVLAHGKHDVHALPFIEVCAELGPASLGHELLAMQIVTG